MKFAIISDTHGNVANFKKAVEWLNKNNIGTVLHCGDIGDPASLKESLGNFQGELFGVFGNMDADYQFLLDEYNDIENVEIKENIFEKEIVSPPSLKATARQGKKVAFVHYPDIAKSLAESKKYNMVFYGHTHKPWKEKVGNCWLLNPGELAGQRFKPTFAIYDSVKDSFELKILEKI